MAQTRPSGYNYKALLCSNIPELFLDKYVARNYFGRFGTLVNFVLRPRLMICTVTYSSEAEAAQALREGKVFNGHTFEICYANSESTSTQKIDEWVDPDVQTELSAISSGWGSDFNSAGNKSNWLAINNNGFSSSTSSAKTLTFKTAERSRPSTQSMAVKQELEAILRKPVHTTEEKYRMLDARDKLVRLSMRRTTDIKTVTTTNGYCPDMCPEKERLLREFQRQVAIFELMPGSDQAIDHHRAIKEYSRSSADQETPLPHELRSEATLHMTMSYLMHEIMDSNYSETHVGDWFHFVWDRTRSIRKEITQQELCSLGAVKLVEQCARFHIHCTARLVAEDPSIFDSKINAENLTKCLQTLKYMYHDLRLKGVQCPREPEFRGYIILLNLADANFLWDVGQLPTELQSCKEIRHAIKFYLALQDTNFVRFFQLLRDPETSYLSACILITYFTQLRVHAMRRIIQAYRAPRKMEISSIPLKHVTQMLSCSDDMETKDFLDYYGITVNDSHRVLLSRIETPEIDYKLRRQYNLVEAKRQESIGECICGEQMPSKSIYQNHRPHNSFNAQGFLNSNAWAASDQMNNSELVEAAPGPPPSAQVTLVEPKPTRKSPTDNLFKVPLATAAVSPRTKSPTLQMAPSLVASKSSMDGNIKPVQKASTAPIFASNSFGSSLTNMPKSHKDTFSGNIFKVSSQTQPVAATAVNATGIETTAAAKANAAEAELQRKKQLQLKRQQQLQQAPEDAARGAKLAAIQCVLQAEEELQHKRAREQIQHVQAKKAELLLLEMVDNTIQLICTREKTMQQHADIVYEQQLHEQVIQLATKEIKDANSELSLMQRYWTKWCNYTLTQRQRNQLFASMPLTFLADAGTNLLDNQNQMIGLQMIRRYRQGEPCNYHNLLRGMDHQLQPKLNMWHLLKQQLQKQEQTPGFRQFCKLLLLLPEHAQMNHTLTQCILLRPTGCHVPSEIQKHVAFVYGMVDEVALCVRKLVGPNLLNECQQPPTTPDLANADGIIVYFESSKWHDTRQALQRLHSNARIRQIAIITLEKTPPDEAAMSDMLLLDTLQLQRFKIFSCTSSQHPGHNRLLALLSRAAQYLSASKNPSRHVLVQADLREWLLHNLGTRLFNTLRYVVSKDACIANHCQQSPQFCVRLYNEALRRLKLVVLENLQSFSDLAAELRIFVSPLQADTPLPNRLEYFIPNWNDHYTRNRIASVIDEAKLPDMDPRPNSNSSASVEQQHVAICEWLLSYAQISQDDASVDIVALQAVQSLAQDLQLIRTDNVHYLNIVEIFAKERLHYMLRKAEQLPAAIVYNRRTMSTCLYSQWYYEWQSGNLVTWQTAPVETATTIMPHSLAGDGLNYKEVVTRAEAILEICHSRKRTLAELNSSGRRANDTTKRHCTTLHKHGNSDNAENIASALTSTKRMCNTSQPVNGSTDLTSSCHSNRETCQKKFF